MKKILFILTIVCASFAASAQSNVAITYSVGLSTGDMSDFIGNVSWRGFNLDYRYMVQPNIGVGINVGWTTFYEELERATYTSDNSSLYGKQFRYSNNVPMAITAAYFLSPDESINPFVGVGIGTMYTRRNTDMSLYTLEQEAWNFLVQPEIGVQFKVTDTAGLHLSAKYNIGFEAGSQLPENQSYIAINIGFCYY